VLHTRVTAAHRATAVSAMSLAMALGAVACLGLPHSTRDEAAIAAEEAAATAV
jgi:hypothetical protein